MEEEEEERKKAKSKVSIVKEMWFYNPHANKSIVRQILYIEFSFLCIYFQRLSVFTSNEYNSFVVLIKKNVILRK